MPILAYHSVSDDWEHPLSVQPGMFRQQIASVSERVVSVEEYLGRFLDGSLTTRHVALTFDDAYADNHEHAFPVLQELELPATVFVPADAIGESRDFWTGTARPVMTADMLGDAVAAGISIGSHSSTHPDLRKLEGDALQREIIGSKDALQSRLGCAVEVFCYPGGFFDERCTNLVSQVYSAGVVTPRRPWGRQSRWTLRRVGIYRHDDPHRFRLKLSPTGQLLRWLSLTARQRGAGPYGP